MGEMPHREAGRRHRRRRADTEGIGRVLGLIEGPALLQPHSSRRHGTAWNGQRCGIWGRARPDVCETR